MKLSQLAINTVSLSGTARLEEVLEACAAAGFAKVEFNIGRLRKFEQGGGSLAQLPTMLERLGLRCIGGFEAALAPLDTTGRAEQLADLAVRNAELLASLGGRTLVVGVDGPAVRPADALEVVARAARSVVERFPAGVALAIEFNWGPMVRSLKAACRVAELADHPSVGVLFDPAHFHCTASKTEDLTSAAVGRILHVHVDDMLDKPGDYSHCNADRALPGQGHLDLASLFGRIEQGGYCGDFSIEMFSEQLWSLPPFEAAKRMHDALRSLVS